LPVLNFLFIFFIQSWSNEKIEHWFFPRNAIPQDITTKTPNPSTWGNPAASFIGGYSCNIANHFRNHRITFDITFCGDWAGVVVPNCASTVKNNPSVNNLFFFFTSFSSSFFVGEYLPNNGIKKAIIKFFF